MYHNRLTLSTLFYIFFITLMYIKLFNTINISIKINLFIQ